MSTDIYVDHLPVDVTAEEIREIFCAYGIVEHVSLIKNRDTGCFCVVLDSWQCRAVQTRRLPRSTTENLAGDVSTSKYPAQLRQQPPPR